MSLPLLWELPGGKLEPGEDPIECIHRETFEELCLEIRILDRLQSVDRTFRDKHYRMIPYLCELAGGTMQVMEHAQATWQPIEQLFDLPWAPAEEMVLRRWVEVQEQAEKANLKAIASR